MKRGMLLNALCVITLAALGLIHLPARATPAQPKRPNVLWLIAEDFGVELGCYGAQEVWTPNLDKLAADGMRFTRA